MHRIAAICADQFLDLLGHCRAEKQGLAVFWGKLVDLAQGMDKAQIEHLIRLIQDQNFERVKVERLLVDQIEQAPGCRNQNICAAMQFVAVFIDAGSANNRLHFHASQRAIILRALSNLSSKLAGWRKHQHPAAFERGLVVGIAQIVDAGQHKGRRLACAGLRDTQKVAPFQYGRNSLRLDRRWCGIVLQVKRLHNRL